MTSLPFHLQPATFSDIPFLAKISSDAFASDRHTQMKALGENTEAHSEAMVRALDSWIATSECRSVLQAVDDVTGEVMGWACWGFHGIASTSGSGDRGNRQQGKEAGGEGTEVGGGGTEVGRDRTEVGGGEAQASQFQFTRKVPEEHWSPNESNKGVTEATSRTNKTALQRLEAKTDADMARWKQILMPLPTTRCMILIAIAVSPSYQSRGAGSALIGWGTAKADEIGVFSWVHASEAGYRMFEKHGYKVVGSLEVDLDEFVDDMIHDGRGTLWGHYTFRYMKRLPAADVVPDGRHGLGER